MEGLGVQKALSEAATSVVLQKAAADRLAAEAAAGAAGRCEAASAAAAAAGPASGAPSGPGASPLPPEVDVDLANIRERRLASLRQAQAARRAAERHGGGEYLELSSEDELLRLTTEQPRVVCHFFDPAFPRCAQLAAALRALAPARPECRFVGVPAARTPFLAARLGLRCLPVTCVFRDAILKAKIVGFEKISTGPAHELDVRKLAALLAKKGVLFAEGGGGARGSGSEDEGEGED